MNKVRDVNELNTNSMFNREMDYLGWRKIILYVIYQLDISLLLGIVSILDYERL